MRAPKFDKSVLGQSMQNAPSHMPQSMMPPAEMGQQDSSQMPMTNPQGYMPSEAQASEMPPQIPQQQSNPFAAEQTSMGGIPDVPIQYGGGMTEILLGDNDIPEEVRKKYWFIFNKDNVLTFLDEERKRSKLLNLDVIKIDILNSTPYYDYNFDLELRWDILRNSYETKLDRALGFKGDGMKNERIVLQSQFSESKQITEQNMGNDGVKTGFFKRLLGRR